MPRRSISQLLLLLTMTGAACAVPIIEAGDDWRYRKGTSAPQANWQTIADAALDSSWLTGAGGFGYGDDDDTTELADMEGSYRSVYIRKAFTVGPGDLPATDEIILSIDYDDAYVAYLDGVEIARSSLAPGEVGSEPAFDDGPSTTREAGSPEFTRLGSAPVALPPGDHVLAILGMNESLDSSDFSLIVDLTSQIPPPPLHWTLADSPVELANTFAIVSGQTLTIDAGVEVRCPTGTNAISCRGVVLANGTETDPIRFVPIDPGGSWGRLEFLGPDESRFTYCEFQRAGSSGIIRARGSDVYLDHCHFIDVDVQMVDLIDSSCTIQFCEFEDIGSGELLHFSDMPPGGHALIAYSRFGTTSGYNDIIDFTGGNRPGPIARFIGNTFTGAIDDVFDMDGTDAHIEGNLFMNVRKDASRASSANPITTGSADGNDSELVVTRNFFFNCEHNVMLKEDGSALMQNNTSFSTTPNPLSDETDADGDEASGIIMFGEPWRGVDYPAGAYYEGNIAAELEVADAWPIYASALADNGCFLRRDQNCVEGIADQPGTGTGNLTGDPMFAGRNGIDESNIRQKLALQAGSPCIGTGPNGLDMGALVPAGASISGEPSGSTSETKASLTIAGPGIWSYRWRLNSGPWSEEISLVPQAIWDGARLTDTMFDDAPPIELSGLADGIYTVEVLGRNSAGDWQETPTSSDAWTVQTNPPDTDSDGMPDKYEIANGFDIDDPDDADEDADGDGSSNLEEFIAGTIPTDPSSVLVITATSVDGDDIILSFDAVEGKSYSLQSVLDLRSGRWQAIDTIQSAPTGPASFTDAGGATGPRKFYRLITPALPEQ